MKKMSNNQKQFEKNLYTGRYFNGQLAVVVHNYRGEPIAELSIMKDSVELAPDEFILKDYSENREIAQEYLETELFTPTSRFVLIGSHLCSICQIAS